jgi:hypothetical protein
MKGRVCRRRALKASPGPARVIVHTGAALRPRDVAAVLGRSRIAEQDHELGARSGGHAAQTSLEVARCEGPSPPGNSSPYASVEQIESCDAVHLVVRGEVEGRTLESSGKQLVVTVEDRNVGTPGAFVAFVAQPRLTLERMYTNRSSNSAATGSTAIVEPSSTTRQSNDSRVCTATRARAGAHRSGCTQRRRASGLRRQPTGLPGGSSTPRRGTTSGTTSPSPGHPRRRLRTI